MAKGQTGTWEPSRVRRRDHTACRQPRHVWFACSSVKSDGQRVYHAFSNAVVRETTVTENPQLTLRLLRSGGGGEGILVSYWRILVSGILGDLVT